MTVLLPSSRMNPAPTRLRTLVAIATVLWAGSIAWGHADGAEAAAPVKASPVAPAATGASVTPTNHSESARGAGVTNLVPATKVTYSEAYGKGKAGQPPEVSGEEMPRFPAVPPTEASSTFRLRPGFRLELAAAEPDVVSPVTMAFDEFGRMFVVEMIDYSERREETPHAGRIRMLEDVDGDGRYERSTVFATDLPWPTALICSQGGVYVGATPDILWLKDTNGDGKADERRVVFTGFGSGATRLNVQALLNSFNWGLDNRIHGATGPLGGTAVRRADGAVAGKPAGRALDLRGLDFSFDPIALDLRPESGGGQYGLSFDTSGRKFVCSNSDHLQQVLFDPRQAGRNPAFAMPSPRVSIAADGPAAEVFRLSPDEPWRIVRTRWRISGVVPGMVEGGGRVSGYFTGATGATVYRGDAYGPAFVDNVFVGDAGGNLVHRKVLSPSADGLRLVAARPSDEQGVEFLASRDTWFRPVHFQNGPDGCLYVVDMYREVIEHPWSLPEAIKRHLDLNSGNDRGRIWRIVPEGFQRPRRPWPGALDAAGLAAALESANGWTRETASRLIHERQERAAVPALAGLLRGSTAPLGRLHALAALEGLGALNQDPGLLRAALADADERVRERAVACVEPRAMGDAEWGRALLAGTDDASVRVRFRAALALGAVTNAGSGPGAGPSDRALALARLARRDAGNPWMEAAVLNALTSGLGDVVNALASDPAFARAPAGRDLLRKLAELAGARHVPTEVDQVLIAASGGAASIAPDGAALVQALLEGARRAGASLASMDASGRLRAGLAAAVRTAQDAGETDAARVAAVSLVALGEPGQARSVLAALLRGTSEAVQVAAIVALGRLPGPEIAPALLGAWVALGPRGRTEALAALTARPERVPALLRAVESGIVSGTDLPAGTVRSLQALSASKESAVAALAARLFPPGPSPADTVRRLQPAVALAGDAARGRVIYLERCAVCHRAGRDGVALGPDLVTVRNAGRDKLLSSIVQPNAEVAPQYIAFQVETRDGESHTALIAHETPSHVTLRLGGGREIVLPRARVTGMASSGTSLMPEGLADGLSVEQMADLLAFVGTAEAAPAAPANGAPR